jgi:hypothetical protein
MRQALYYPWIDIHDEGWLKTALLYWDSVRTIVPEAIDAPYSTITGRALQEAGFLIPLRVRSGMEEIEELVSDVITYIGSAEGAELLISGHGASNQDIHVEKLPYELGRFADIHPEKLPYKIRDHLQEIANSYDRGNDWLRVDEKFADFYMTLLASRLADRVGARLLTSLAAADRLAVSARLDAQLSNVIPLGMNQRGRYWREYEAFGPRHHMPRCLASGMLANLAIERIRVDPDTPIDHLIEFRERHLDELAQFQVKMESLASSIETDLPVEALRQRVSDLYESEVAPAMRNLKAALHGRRIRWLGDGLLKIGFMSVGPTSMLAVAGLAVPTALLAGAGISFIASKAMYNVDKEEALRSNPFAYLLSMERELS